MRNSSVKQLTLLEYYFDRAYRSISPNTMSSDPMIAATSASMWPRVRKSIACKCANEGDSARRPCFELLFATVDSTIDHLTPELRASVEKLCSRSASLNETIRAVTSSLTMTRATLARIESRPHLVALPAVERR